MHPARLAPRLHVTDYGKRIECALLNDSILGNRLYMAPGVVSDIGDSLVPEPTFTMDRTMAQELADELARNGFVQKVQAAKVAELQDQLAAQARVIERLRAVAFAAMELAKP